MRIGDDGVAASTALVKVAQLEVSSKLVESETIHQIVIYVAGVEQLCHDKVNVLLGGKTIRLSVVVDEGQALIDWSVVEQVVVLTLPIFMSDNVVSNSGVECGGVLGDIHSGQMLTSPGVVIGGNLMPSPRRRDLVPWFGYDGQVTGRGVVDT